MASTHTRRDAPSAPRSRRFLFTGLALLTLGLALLDRGFAAWRNDPSTLPPIDGPASPTVASMPSGAPAKKHPERSWMMLSGGGLVLVSILLFARKPV